MAITMQNLDAAAAEVADELDLNLDYEVYGEYLHIIKPGEPDEVGFYQPALSDEEINRAWEIIKSHGAGSDDGEWGLDRLMSDPDFGGTVATYYLVGTIQEFIE